jgi:predicted RNase H-like HicB family nuclease
MTKSYLVVFVKGKGDDAGYMGYSPDVPRCISTGDNAEDMRAMMKEALEFHLEGLIEDGDPIPEPHTTKVEFDPAIKDEVDHYLVEWLSVSVPGIALSSSPQRAAIPA